MYAMCTVLLLFRYETASDGLVWRRGVTSTIVRGSFGESSCSRSRQPLSPAPAPA